MENYTQCSFEKDNHRTHGWIPSWAAKVGNNVQLISLDGDFWCVVSAGEIQPMDAVKAAERNYKDFQHSIK